MCGTLQEYAATGEWVSGNPMNSIKEAYACILAFDVPVLPDAERMAKDIGIPIYTAEIIYHLFDSFTKRVAAVKAKKKEEARKKALWPYATRPLCVLLMGLASDAVQGSSSGCR